jgi:hypothetical protein
MFLSVDVGCSRIYSSDNSWGLTIEDFYIDGGHSWISFSTCQWVRHRHFLVLMAVAPGSLAPAPPRGPVIDIA